jgi:hypothetical protein
MPVTQLLSQSRALINASSPKFFVASAAWMVTFFVFSAVDCAGFGFSFSTLGLGLAWGVCGCEGGGLGASCADTRQKAISKRHKHRCSLTFTLRPLSDNPPNSVRCRLSTAALPGTVGSPGRAKRCLSRPVLYVAPRRVRPLSYNSVGAVRPDVHDATKTPGDFGHDKPFFAFQSVAV